MSLSAIFEEEQRRIIQEQEKELREAVGGTAKPPAEVNGKPAGAAAS
jgi:hypothetical protein